MTKKTRPISHDALKRPDAPDLEAQVAAYLKGGGTIKQIPIGEGANNKIDPLRRGIATPEYASSRGRKPGPKSQFIINGRKVKFEDG